MSASTSHAYARSSSTLSVHSAPSMSRMAVYKPPRSSPLAGPAISVNSDDEGDNDTEPQRTCTSRTPSRLPTLYPTPPRTPPPGSSSSSKVEVQDAANTQEIGVSVIDCPNRSRSSKSQLFPKQDRPMAADTTTIEASSQLLADYQNRLLNQRSSVAYVRTPFSAPQIILDSHPTYDASTITRRAARRPRTAPNPSSSSSSSAPRERGTFSAPAIIESPATSKRHGTLNADLDSNRGIGSSLSSPLSSRRMACPNTSAGPELNWITYPNNSPPPFSRTGLRSVVMPIKASKVEVRKSTKRPRTAPVSGASSVSPFPSLQVQGLKVPPLVLIQSSKEESREGNRSVSAPAPPPLNRNFNGGQEHESKYEKDNAMVLDYERPAIDESRIGTGTEKRKWKQLLRKFSKLT